MTHPVYSKPNYCIADMLLSDWRGFAWTRDVGKTKYMDIRRH